MKLYNTYSRTLETFTPLFKNEIKMYVCGITPYDITHLGHAFTYTFFDAFIRYLKYTGQKVSYVQNVTDIDDDILKRAKRDNRDWKELGEYWTKIFLKDLESLNVEMPTQFVKATDSIDSMIKIIKVLIKKKFAYVKGGNVYFEWKKFKDYGKLSRFNKSQMTFMANERGLDLNNLEKKDPLDFILWQSVLQIQDNSIPESKVKNNNPFWNSPWGNGRPGWHIECSAMIYKYLGNQIDIHGGGKDLMYPHHESEIAQSETFTSTSPYAQIWMHTAMVMYNGEKMSKSLGNLVLIRDLLKKYSPLAIRFTLLSHYYKTPWEFDEQELKDSELILDSLNKIDFDKTLLSTDSRMQIFKELMDADVRIDKVIDMLKNNEIKDKQVIATILQVLGFTFLRD